MTLACVIVLGPRLGKYNGASKAIAGHSMPLAAIGVFLLWFGWFGFNGGSVLSADPGAVSLVRLFRLQADRRRDLRGHAAGHLVCAHAHPARPLYAGDPV